MPKFSTELGCPQTYVAADQNATVYGKGRRNRTAITVATMRKLSHGQSRHKFVIAGATTKHLSGTINYLRTGETEVICGV